MKRKEDMKDMMEELGDKLMAAVYKNLLGPALWKPAVIKGDEVSKPYLVVSKDIGGMVLIARMIDADDLYEVSEDDLMDMVLGAGDKTKN